MSYVLPVLVPELPCVNAGNDQCGDCYAVVGAVSWMADTENCWTKLLNGELAPEFYKRFLLAQVASRGFIRGVCISQIRYPD